MDGKFNLNAGLDLGSPVCTLLVLLWQVEVCEERFPERNVILNVGIKSLGRLRLRPGMEAPHLDTHGLLPVRINRFGSYQPGLVWILPSEGRVGAGGSGYPVVIRNGLSGRE